MNCQLYRYPKSDNITFTAADAKKALRENDFILMDDGSYIAEEISLEFLDKSEIVSCKPID